uniref:CCHC-type domain-containing protein n=1 Tax=Trichuris muris TaxID=70415 RepID=A0A5S6R4F0_TRIMR
MDPEQVAFDSGSSMQYISIEKLNGLNYASWSFKMKLVLMECDLWTTVQPGEELKDTDDHRKMRLHECRQGKAFAKICLALGDEQQQYVQHLSSPKDVWEELQRLYAPKDSKLRILQLRRQLYSEKLESHGGMDAYLGKINHIVTELTNIGDRTDDGDLAMTILCGLPEDWDVVISSICNLPESEFCCSTVKRRLIAEWARRIESSGKCAEAMAATTAERKSTDTRQSTKSTLVCFRCGKLGHFARECTSKAPKSLKHPKAATGKQPKTRPCNMFASYGTCTDNKSICWIVDSGATHHMCPDKRYFTRLGKADVTNSRVRTSDASTTLAGGKGTVMARLLRNKGMLDKFVAHNTLVVPGIKQGVLSLRQMVENNRRVVFDKRGCHIYDEQAAYIRNRVTNRHNEEKTPYELWFNLKPSLRHLRACGCKVYVNIQAQKRKSKLDWRAHKGLLVGYALSGKGWRMWVPELQRVVVSRDCTFLEDEKTVLEKDNKPNCKRIKVYFPGGEADADSLSNVGEGSAKEKEQCFLKEDPECKPLNPKRKRGRQRRDSWSLPEVRQSLRAHPMLLRSQNPNISDNSQSDVKDASQSHSNSTAPKDTDHSSSATLACNQLAVDNPTSYHEAIKGNEASEWLTAMEAEMESLRDHNVWTLEELSKGTKPIKCKWGFQRKTNAAGEVVHFKARLVAKGFSQREGIDYDDVYAPVTSFEIIRILAALGVSNNWTLDQFDVKKCISTWSIERGVKFSHFNDGGVTLTQEAYIQCLLQRYRMQDAKGVNTPMEMRPFFMDKGSSEETTESLPYKEQFYGAALDRSQASVTLFETDERARNNVQSNQ